MPPKKKAANGYKLAEPLPKGTILEDIAKSKWRLGPSIGRGGFGEIYSAQAESGRGSSFPYVVKIEPHANGPLFVEINFYIRNSKQADIEDFKKSRGLKTLGMPVYLGSGSHEYKSEKYRFLVMEKFGTDLHKLYTENGKQFPTHTVFQLGVQVLDTLEYIHSRGYVHADIKGANILMGTSKDTQNKQVYLVDFGLATKYSTEKEYKPNPKKAHDGTIEYLSRDAHQGVQTRRGDLEILAYNMIQWLGCMLPWEKNLKDPKVVQQSKEENMADVSKMIKSCFKDGLSAPKAIVEFLKYLHTLKFDTAPDYKKVKKVFIAGVKEAGGSIESALSFSLTKIPTKRKGAATSNAKSPKRSRNEVQISHSDEEDSPEEVEKVPPKKKASKKEINGNTGNSNGVETPKSKEKKIQQKARSTKRTVKVSDNESDEDSDDHKNEEENEPPKEIPRKRGGVKKEAPTTSANQNGMEGYTDAMKQIMLKMQNDPKKNGGKRAARKKPEESVNVDMDGYNDEMKEIAAKKQTRGRKPTKKGIDVVSEKGDSDIEGYNEEMKEISAKKKGNKQAKSTDPISIPTTSKVKPERGLVKPNSKKLLAKPPSTHIDVVKLQDNCDSSDC